LLSSMQPQISTKGKKEQMVFISTDLVQVIKIF